MKTAAIGGWGLVLAGALALLPGVVSAQHFPPDADLETMLRYLVEDGETPGLVLGEMVSRREVALGVPMALALGAISRPLWSPARRAVQA